MEIVSVFTVTDFKTGKEYTEFIEDAGQQGIRHLRSLYPRYSKFVLEGFELDGDFVRLDLRTYNRA